MRIRTIIAVSVLIAIVLGAATVRIGAQEKKHAIDVWLEKAIEKDGSTHGMRRATEQATAKWDAELNRVYKKLMSTLKPKQKAALVKSQKAWIAYRDAEFKTIAEIVGKKDGTMWPLVADGEAMGIVKGRALQLAGYLENAMD